MTSLSNYMQDGANHQARAVLCFLQGMTMDIDDLASPVVARWENCREQGYIVSLISGDYTRQLNIIFFEHRNSDIICAVRWEQTHLNSITIETAKFGDVYQRKFDVSHSVDYGQVKDMANWIEKEFESWWEETSKPISADRK